MASAMDIKALADAVYSQKPLNDERDIRVLHIEPADNLEDPVICNLHVAPLDNPDTKYQTLSYAWGDPTADAIVLCDGRPLPVTCNLKRCLQRIRAKLAPSDILFPEIWIDAICINQTDDDEKSAQVAMMGHIYTQSRRLIIWLGDASAADTAHLRLAISRHPEITTDHGPLLRLVQQPYFQRRWIIPELMQSPIGKRHILIGDLRFNFELLALPLRDIPQDTELAEAIETNRILRGWVKDTGPSNVHSLLRSKDSVSDLLSNLQYFSGTLCSRPKDLIYALRSISTMDASRAPLRSVVDPTFVVDYGESFQETFTRFARTIYVHFLLECASDRRSHESLSSGLPSWVPDWRVQAHFRPRTQIDLLPNLTMAIRNCFDEPRDQKTNANIEHIHPSIKNRTLLLSGWLFRSCGHTVEGDLRSCAKCSRIGIEDWAHLEEHDDTPQSAYSDALLSRSTSGPTFCVLKTDTLQLAYIGKILVLVRLAAREEEPVYAFHSCIRSEELLKLYYWRAFALPNASAAAHYQNPICIE